jgi:hypothetical protein
MKKITALVTTLVLGASSAAMAAPGFHSYGPENNRTPIQRPFRPIVQSWTTLESSGSLSRGRDMIDVSTNARFSKLKLESAGRGSLFIDKLVIVFANGQRQVVSVGKTIGARTGAAFIDLDGRSRQIDKVMVVGKGSWRGSYTLAAL